MKRTSWLVLVAPVALGVILLLGWYLSTTPGAIPNYLVPTPMAVVRELYNGLIVYADLWPFFGITLGEALAGSLVGLSVALPLAVMIYRSRVVSAAVRPFLGATQAIPAIAIAPVLAAWVGFGMSGKVALCALMVFFPILVSSVVGLRHIDRDILAAAQVDGAGSLALLIEVEIPLALHNILAGVRNGFTLSITGAVVGELVMGGSGLGSLLTVQRESLNMAGMFATIIVLCVLATTLYSLIAFIERRWSAIIAPLPEGEK